MKLIGRSIFVCVYIQLYLALSLFVSLCVFVKENGVVKFLKHFLTEQHALLARNPRLFVHVNLEFICSYIYEIIIDVWFSDYHDDLLVFFHVQHIFRGIFSLHIQWTLWEVLSENSYRPHSTADDPCCWNQLRWLFKDEVTAPSYFRTRSWTT